MRASRRVTALALGLTLLLIAAVVLGLFLRSSTPRAHSSTSRAHWLRDTFNYEPPAVIAYVGGGPGPYVPTASLSAVSAASRDDAWVIGSGPCCLNGEIGRSLAWHWNGAKWLNVPMPRVRNAYTDLSSVATTDSRDAWAVGEARTFTVSPSGRQWPGHDEALTERWDGKRWTLVRLPNLGASWLREVSASASRNVWAVGGMYGPNHFLHLRRLRTLPLLLRWNGTTWREVPVPWARPGVTLDKVVATGTDSVWVVAGASEAAKGALSAGALEYWDGKRWTRIPPPFGPSDSMRGFAATSGSDAWATGSYALGGHDAFGKHYAAALAAHWNGSDWQIAPVPKLARASNVWLGDVAMAGPDDAWLSSFNLLTKGKHGRVNVAVLEHWDGRSWRITSGTPPPVQSATPSFGISVAPDGTAWAITAGQCDNVVFGWSGHVWQMSPHPVDRDWTYVSRAERVSLRRSGASSCGRFGGFRAGPTGASGPTG